MKLSFLKNNPLYVNLLLSIAFALLLVAFRVQMTHTLFYLFLVWNLFLAGIPFLITQAFKQSRWRYSKGWGGPIFITWLLFLPNSPYIITDLVHLHNQNSSLKWFDLFLVFVYAVNGLVLGLLSLLDMSNLIKERYGKTAASYIIFKVCLLSGFGIYLGRFLRFNSWDVATKPKLMFFEIIQNVRDPKVWMVTFAFGGFLWILFSLLKSVLLVREVQIIEKRK